MTEKPQPVCDDCGEPFGDRVVWGYGYGGREVWLICDDCHGKAAPVPTFPPLLTDTGKAVDSECTHSRSDG